MKNMNDQIASLLEEVKKVQFSNPLFASFAPAFSGLSMEALEGMKSACFLSDELLAAADVTLIRIEKQEQINAYIRVAKTVFDGLTQGKGIPDWAVRDEDDVSNFSQFFSNIDADQTPKLLGGVEYVSGSSLDAVKKLYVDWQALVEQESLKREFIARIQHASDLRHLLKALLRVFGYGQLAVDAVGG